jgi:hypothetical protein
MKTFSYTRRTPTNVLFVQFGLNLVSTGGSALKDLREDVYDNARNSAKDGAEICGVYAIALSGGEPYSVWK